MLDKYKEITIFECENGWIVKEVQPDTPNEFNQVAYTSTFCKDADSLIELIKEIVRNKK